MVVTRSGKNTNRYEAPTLVCGHKCSNWHQYCCYCSDIRPVQRVYMAHNRSNLFEVSYVPRNYYYCPVCKLSPPPVKTETQEVSVPVVFHPTTEYKLAEAEKRIKYLEARLNDNKVTIEILNASNLKGLQHAEEVKKLNRAIENLSLMVEKHSNQAVYWYDQCKAAEDCNNDLHARIDELNKRNCSLTERIRDPFKSAISRPNF
jgi:hypothetical protein